MRGATLHGQPREAVQLGKLSVVLDGRPVVVGAARVEERRLRCQLAALASLHHDRLGDSRELPLARLQNAGFELLILL